MTILSVDIETGHADVWRTLGPSDLSGVDGIDDIALTPDGRSYCYAFAVMRDGMQGKVGVGKLALYGREYLVAVRPLGRGIVMPRCITRRRSAASMLLTS